MKLTKALALAIGLTLCSVAFAQTRQNAAYQQYIEQYKQIAIDQMRKHHIPASITLAQAILESAAGKSDLAQRSNNHFGIKVGSSWTGPYVTHDDDRRGERFRKYDSPEQSYEDHSQFLLRDRYKPLFKLGPLDYQAWARGLKACGYATSPTYAAKLIELIELYDLHQYDEDRMGLAVGRKRNVEPVVVTPVRHQVSTVNGIRCVQSREGDTWESIAKETKIPVKKLLAFNEVDADFTLPANMNVFLAKKATKGDKQYDEYWHKVKANESMYEISQQYGIRVKNLYKLNFKDGSYIPLTGDLLRVR